MTKKQNFYFRPKHFYQTWAKTPKIIWNLLKNKQFGETATKLKVDKGGWKLSNFTKNCLEVIFVTKMPIISFIQKQFVWLNIDPKRFKSAETGRKTTNTAKQQEKLDVNQKLVKNTQNRLEIFFITKDVKQCKFK